MLTSINEGLKYPDLFLVDENVAIAMSFYEIMLLLQNVFGLTARALKFIIKCDVNPTLPKDIYTRNTEKDFTNRQFIHDMNEAEMYQKFVKDGDLE